MVLTAPLVCKDIALCPWRKSKGGVIRVFISVEVVLLQKT